MHSICGKNKTNKNRIIMFSLVYLELYNLLFLNSSLSLSLSLPLFHVSIFSFLFKTSYQLDLYLLKQTGWNQLICAHENPMGFKHSFDYIAIWGHVQNVGRRKMYVNEENCISFFHCQSFSLELHILFLWKHWTITLAIDYQWNNCTYDVVLFIQQL